MEKKEITNDDVIQEFGAIKESSSTGFIIVIIILLLSLGVCIYLLLTKEPSKVNNLVCEESPKEEEVITIKSGHTLDTLFGKFVVDSDGFVYFLDNEKISISEKKYKLSTDSITLLGDKKDYINKTYANKTEKEADKYKINAYKLDLTNISSSYYVEYNTTTTTYGIIFLTYDGLVNELSITLNDQQELVLSLNKNIQGLSNITSVITTTSVNESNAILIDKYGNKFDYKGSLNKTER